MFWTVFDTFGPVGGWVVLGLAAAAAGVLVLSHISGRRP